MTPQAGIVPSALATLPNALSFRLQQKARIYACLSHLVVKL